MIPAFLLSFENAKMDAYFGKYSDLYICHAAVDDCRFICLDKSPGDFEYRFSDKKKQEVC